VRELDPEVRAFNCTGRLGWRGRGPFRDHLAAIAGETALVWVTGTCAASLACAKPLRRPTVLSHHHHHRGGRAAWLRWRGFYEVLCRNLDAIVFPTEFTRAEAIGIAPWLAPRTHVIPNGVKPQSLSEDSRLILRRDARRTLGLPEDALVVMNAGWLSPGKRFDVFLRTAALVKQAIPDSVFVICGTGSLEPDLRRLAAELGIADSVRFEGWVLDLTAYHRACDIFLFNSDFEAFGRSPLEAANHGAIVVASVRHGGLSEWIEHGTNGVLFPDHDVPALADAVINLGRGADAERLRRNAFASIKRRYDIAASAADHSRLFASLR
jgi:glycosyltransferase involved in cell wall biosynthesis